MVYRNNLKILLITLLVGLFINTSKAQQQKEETVRFAVIADAHFQDVYGTLSDVDFSGIPNPVNGKKALIRTMQSQLQSTRIFNENYFALRAALDDIAERNIKFLIMPGDFSDDGQEVHIRGLKKILDEYTLKYGIQFFLITGNHDVVHPYYHEDGKTDFLGAGGMPQALLSSEKLIRFEKNGSNQPIISQEMGNLGYAEIADKLSDFGFFPQPGYRFWTTPFSDYSYSTYSLAKAEAKSSLQKRSFEIPGNGKPLPDLSYVVEPVEGLWLLALDANTYLLKDTNDFKNNGQGLNNLLSHKKYLMDWVRKMVVEAEQNEKLLIAFSHYPMVDFNNGASEAINKLLIGPKMQLNRLPDPELAAELAEAGLKIHLGGHMHLNDTGSFSAANGNTLINIQTPSLAAYPAAYKILSFTDSDEMQVETVRLNSVEGFDSFFELYLQEYEFLKRNAAKNLWNEAILNSESYAQLMDWHLKELVRLRFIPSEWPEDITKYLLEHNFKEILELATFPTNQDQVTDQKASETQQISNTYLENWTGLDLIEDLYRLRGADALAIRDIGPERLQAYEFMIHEVFQNQLQLENGTAIQQQILNLIQILNRFLNGEPSDTFSINIKTGTIKDLSGQFKHLHNHE